MSIIKKIQSLFDTIPQTYKQSEIIYNNVSPFYYTLVKNLDCELFHPNSFDILEEIKVQDPNLYNQLLSFNPNLKDYDTPEKFNSLFNLEDLNSFNDELSKKSVIENINTKVLTTNDALKYAKEKLKPILCIEDKISTDKTEEFKEILKNNIKSDFSGDDKFKEFIDKCTVNSTNKYPKDLIKNEELIKAINDCFISTEEEGIELETPTENPYKNFTSPSFEDLDTSPNLEQDFTSGDFLGLLSLLGDKSDCIEEVSNKIKEMQSVTEEYTNHITKKVEVEKEYAYYTIYNEFLKSVISEFGDLNIGGDLSITKNLTSKDFDDFSKEIKFRKNTKYSSDNIILFDLNIRKIKNPTKKDGSYFKTYFDLDDEFKKFKEKEISEEQAKKLDSKIISEFIKNLNNAKRKIKRSGKTSYNNIVNTLLINNLGNAIRVSAILKKEKNKLNSFYADFLKIYNPIKSTYENFEKVSNDYVKKLNDIGIEIENLSGICSDQDREFGESGPILNFDENATGDFRGIPDPKNPTMYDKKYWERFAEMATVLNLIPFPQLSVSNRLSVNLAEPNSPKVKIPVGTPVLDDDGIPRFMFYPIGLIIPTPISSDLIYRIPLPMLWKVISVFTIENPLKILMKKLLEIQSLLSAFNEYEKFLTPDMNINRLWHELPKGLMVGLLAILLLDESLPIQTINREIGKFIQSIQDIVNKKLEELLNSPNLPRLTEENLSAYIEILQRGIDEFINNNLSEINTFIEKNLKGLELLINDNLAKIDFSELAQSLERYILDALDFINLGKDLLGKINSCFNTNYNFDFDIDLSILNDIQKYGGQNLNLLAGLKFPKFTIPYIRTSDFFDFDLSLYPFEFFKDLKININASNIFLKFPLLLQDLKDFLLSYYYKLLKYKFWEFDFQIQKLIKLKIPNILIDNLSLALLDFNEMIFVVFIGFSGIIPYPYILMINHGQNPISGIIDARTIQFLLTLDLKNPIKVIKNNFGSYTLPLKFMIEDFINSGFGLYFNPITGNYIDICNMLFKLGFSIDDILGNLDLIFKLKLRLPDLWNLFEFPDFNLICKMSQIKDSKEALKTLLASTRINDSLIPPIFSKLSAFTKYGITDFNGQLIIDEFKQTFGDVKFPNINEMFSLDNMKSELILDQFGFAKKMRFDLLPQLTLNSPYLQDDLPPWERLQWWNAPFLLFLVEFNIAAKFGAVLPIPEVSPLAKMR